MSSCPNPTTIPSLQSHISPTKLLHHSIKWPDDQFLRVESKVLMAENKNREGELKPVWFAAGMAAFMACLERFYFYTHWRVWVFLALNLLLLAILFTSTMQTQIPSNDQVDNCVEAYEEEKKKKKKTRSKKCRPNLVSANNYLPKSEGLCVKIAAEYEEDDEYGKEGSLELSKEELNERVEAFIKMFRQQYLHVNSKNVYI
ncbi:unnamed protein product [Fraxinus pennsylvanica]|uniref:Uncharacterized protein n=1 Tax=Fraxinus pennsylvanica TaxID=56036 RepID=A0AAD1YWW8_9LAMI|nr:unnamed protein product [Fraxinus pennsylvanica]